MRKESMRRKDAAPAKQAPSRRPLRLETLEPRNLFTATPWDEALSAGFSGHAGVCQCPVCTGVGLEEIAVVSMQAAAPSAAGLVTSVPQLSSNPAARAKLYLDFNGHVQPGWGNFNHVVTPAFDQDGRLATLGSGELATIRGVWARVAEDYAPFNIDVTTIAPGHLSKRVVAHVAIGGHYSDWYGSSAGGVAYVGGFYNALPNVAYVFEDALGNGNTRYLAEAISHEAGHLFGLQHQAVWSGGTLVDAYNSGDDRWAPIMGTGYYADRTTWHRGPNSTGASAIQDDMAILAGSANGFGWRADDFGNTLHTATNLPAAGSSVNFTGLIGSTSDVDTWRFTTSGGSANFQLSGAQFGGNLDAVLELRNATGQTIATSAPGGSLGASVMSTLQAGTYYLAARSQGGYGNVGQYTIRGTLPVAASIHSSPEISVRMQTVEITDGAAIGYGSTTVGAPITRTFTVVNTGRGTLTLSPIGSSGLPAGFSLVSNLSRTSLAAGQSATFSLRFDARQAGTVSGQLTLRSSDPNERSFEVRLLASASGTSPAPLPPATNAGSSTPPLVKRVLDNGASGHTKRGQWNRSTGQGVQEDLDRAAKGTGSSYSTWSFPGIANGKYQVYAAWPGGSTHATNAPFTLYNGSTPTATVRMNQRVASSGLTADGATWKYLGTVQITGGRLNVRLTNAANGFVVADAIRIVQMPASAAAIDGLHDSQAADLGLLAWLGGEEQSSAAAIERVAVVRAANQGDWTSPDDLLHVAAARPDWQELLAAIQPGEDLDFCELAEPLEDASAAWEVVATLTTGEREALASR
ncbi:MAG: choice-of-anchor D domain-containing protein [Pirellulaceae bacterium]